RRERVDDVLADDAEDAAALPAVHRNQLVIAIAHLARMGERRTLDRFIVSADGFKDAQPVFVDVDSSAGGAQTVGALMHAHAPATLRQGTRRGQAGKSGAGNFRVAFGHAASELANDMSSSAKADDPVDTVFCKKNSVDTGDCWMPACAGMTSSHDKLVGEELIHRRLFLDDTLGEIEVLQLRDPLGIDRAEHLL